MLRNKKKDSKVIFTENTPVLKQLTYTLIMCMNTWNPQPTYSQQSLIFLINVN